MKCKIYSISLSFNSSTWQLQFSMQYFHKFNLYDYRMAIFSYLVDYWMNSWSEDGFNFGPKVPTLDYDFSEKELGQIFARRRELIKHFSSIDTINKLLWLWFGINDKTFEYLCAYFAERELWYSTDIRWGFTDQWIDVSGCRGTKTQPEFIAIQCKQWNVWRISERGMSEIYEKMAHTKSEHNAKLLLATSSYVDYRGMDANRRQYGYLGL